MSRKTKKIDAVAMMRAARDNISETIEGMSLEEELEWLASQDLRDPFLERLRNRAVSPRDVENRDPARRY